MNPALMMSNKDNIPVGVHRDGDDRVTVRIETFSGRKLYMREFGYFNPTQTKAREAMARAFTDRLIEKSGFVRRLMELG